MRGDGGNHHETLGRKGNSCASQFTIPDMAGTSPDPVCNSTKMRSSQPNQASCTPDISYPLVSTTSFSSSSHITPFLVHNSTLITEHNVKSSLTISPSHDHELTPSTTHTESTAYTEYRIPQVQHSSKILCLLFIVMIRS